MQKVSTYLFHSLGLVGVVSRERMAAWTSIYRKPMHTDQYLHFESHHPTHVKRCGEMPP